MCRVFAQVFAPPAPLPMLGEGSSAAHRGNGPDLSPGVETPGSPTEVLPGLSPRPFVVFSPLAGLPSLSPGFLPRASRPTRSPQRTTVRCGEERRLLRQEVL